MRTMLKPVEQLDHLYSQSVWNFTHSYSFFTDNASYQTPNCWYITHTSTNPLGLTLSTNTSRIIHNPSQSITRSTILTSLGVYVTRMCQETHGPLSGLTTEGYSVIYYWNTWHRTQINTQNFNFSNWTTLSSVNI